MSLPAPLLSTLGDLGVFSLDCGALLGRAPGAPPAADGELPRELLAGGFALPGGPRGILAAVARAFAGREVPGGGAAAGAAWLLEGLPAAERAVGAAILALVPALLAGADAEARDALRRVLGEGTARRRRAPNQERCGQRVCGMSGTVS